MGIEFGLRLFYIAFNMFADGEKFRDIRSMCLFEFGRYFYDRENINKAISCYHKALSLNPANYYACVGLAAALGSKKSFGEALNFLKRAISIRKADISTLVLLFVTLESLGDEISSREVVKQILKSCDNNEAATYDRIAFTYFRLSMYKEAEYYIKKALYVDPNNEGIHFNLGKIYLAEGRLKDARDEFQKVVEITSKKQNKEFQRKATRYIKSIDKID